MKKYIKPTAEMIEVETFNLLHGDSINTHNVVGNGQLSKKNFVLWEDEFDDDESTY